MSMLWRRRDFLQGTALALALAAWQRPRPALAQGPAPRWASDPFSLGVASGVPRPDGVVLWMRLAPEGEGAQDAAARGPVTVRWEVFADEALRHPVVQGQAIADAQRAHSVHVQLRGLAPDRFYWYRFTCGEAQSRVGRTRTAPAADATPARLRLALASCQHYEYGFYAAHREIAGQDLDAVLFVGDYIYEGHVREGALRRHTPGVPHDLDAYRARHAQYKRDPDLQAAHAAHPWLLTWDDHEVVNDYTGDREPDPVASEVFLRRRAAAYQAYFEHMPLALAPDGPAMRIHDRFDWGRLARLWTLDCRQHRSHHACFDPERIHGRWARGDCAELRDPSRSVLGADQERWFAQGIAGSTARWNLLAQSTQLSPTSQQTPQGRQYWTDGWDGYPLARERLMAAAHGTGKRNVVTLGGDVHRFVAADLRLHAGDPSSPVVASEFVGGSVTSRGASRHAMERLMRDNPDVHHARGDERGYAVLTVDARQAHCAFRATPTPALADATLSTQAAFVVESGRAGVQVA